MNTLSFSTFEPQVSCIASNSHLDRPQNSDTAIRAADIPGRPGRWGRGRPVPDLHRGECLRRAISAKAPLLRSLILGAVLLFSSTSALAQRIPIERAQREYQARHFVVKGYYVNWPVADAGAPPLFPEDNFYGDLSQNPKLGRDLVRHLATQFYTVEKIYDSFVNTPDGVQNVENAGLPPYYAAGNMASINTNSIDIYNYPPYLNTIIADIRKLQYIRVPASLVNRAGAAGTDPESRGASDYGEPDEESAMTMTSIWWANGSWYPGGAPIGQAGWTWYYEDSGTWNAELESGAGRIRADLTRYAGTAKVMLRLSDWLAPDGGNSAGWPVTFNGNYHTYASTTCGGVYLSGVLAEAQPDFTGGWQITPGSPYVLMKPAFKTDAQPASCAVCTKCALGASNARAGSVLYEINMGQALKTVPVGYLVINEDTPSPGLFAPATLRVCASPDVSRWPTNLDQPVLQILSPQGLVDIVTNSATKYTMSFYPWNSGYQPGVHNGPVGAAFKTNTVEQNGATNSLKITEATIDATQVTTYTYTDSLRQWEVLKADGLRKEYRTTTWDSAQTNRTEAYVVKNSANQTLYQETTTYWVFPWGQEMVNQIIGESTANPLTNSWTFYANAGQDGYNYGRLKQFIDSNGHWERYAYDDQGRCTNTVSQIGNANPSTADDQSRVLSVIYSTSNPAVTRIEKYRTHEVARSYLVYNTDEVQDIRCQTAAAAYNASDNLVTITKRYPDGVFYTGEVKSIRRPDGTMTFYTYTPDQTTNSVAITVSTGQPNANNDALLNGTQTISVIGSKGETRSIQTWQITNGSTDIQLAGETDLYDYLGRSTNVTYLGGLVEDRGYGGPTR